MLLRKCLISTLTVVNPHRMLPMLHLFVVSALLSLGCQFPDVDSTLPRLCSPLNLDSSRSPSDPDPDLDPDPALVDLPRHWFLLKRLY